MAAFRVANNLRVCQQLPHFARIIAGHAPRVEVVEEGTKISLRTLLKADRQHIQLTGRIDLASIIDVGVASAAAVGENLFVQVPRVSRRQISVSAEIADGASLLVGWPPSFDRKDFFYVLLTVRHIVLPAE